VHVANVGIQNAYNINLQHRGDRQRQIEQTLGDASIPFERFEAVNARLDENKHLIEHCFDATICPGQVGCQLSHMRVLDAAMARSVEHIAVFEDDFVFQGHVNLSMV
jgi:glycosyl transferase family 25